MAARRGRRRVLRQVLACAVARLAACGEPPSAVADGRELARGGLAELCAAVLVTCSAVLSPLCVLRARLKLGHILMKLTSRLLII